MKKIFILCICILFLACDKNKNISAKLNIGDWKVVEISVNDSLVTNETEWRIQGCDIYDQVCTGTWHLDADYRSFYWQFTDKGKTFAISNVDVVCEGCEITFLDQLSYDLSGKYKVVKHKKTEFIFESSTLEKYYGKNVRIKVVKG